jgi:hypothetical protein
VTAQFSDYPPQNSMGYVTCRLFGASTDGSVMLSQTGALPSPNGGMTFQVTVPSLSNWNNTWLRNSSNNQYIYGQITIFGTENDGTLLTSFYNVLIYSPPTTSGTMNKNEMWNGTIQISGNITIPSGITLTIDPATTIKFGGYYSISVNSGSKIIAEGTQANPIRFTPATGTTPGSWSYVKVQGGVQNSNSSFKHCTFEYGVYPLYLYNATSGNPTVVENCIFQNNSHYGIRIYGSKASIKDCEMKNNGYYGIHFASIQQSSRLGGPEVRRFHHSKGSGA